MRKTAIPVLAFSAACVLAGCRTTKDILTDYEKDLAAGQYEHASVEVGEKADKGGDNALMWQLHAAGAKSLATDFEEAIRRFDTAEDAFAKNDQESTFSQGASGALAMMTNDNAFPYAGGGQDRIFTCLYKAVDHGVKGDVDAMRTELNRAAQHQENWLFERRKEIDAATERLKQDAEEYRKKNSQQGEQEQTAEETSSAVEKAMADGSLAAQIKENCDFDPTCDGQLDKLSTKDYMNVYVQCVCGLFRWLSGEDDGKYFLRDAAALKADNAMLKEDFATADSGVRPKDTVWVFVEDGLCPVRDEWRIDLPLVLIPGLNQYVMYAGMAFPKLNMRNPAAVGYSVVAGGQTVQMAELESMDRLLKTEFDVYMRGALMREITRVIVKAGVQITLGVLAEHTSNNYAKIALKSSQVAAATWAFAVTGADVRSWTGLPKGVYACRVQRPADGNLIVDTGNEKIEVAIPAGNALVFLRKPTVTSPSVAKVIPFAN